MSRALPTTWEALGSIEASYQQEGEHTVRVSISGDEGSPSNGDIAQELSRIHGGDDWAPAKGTFYDCNWSSGAGGPGLTRLFRCHDPENSEVSS